AGILAFQRFAPRMAEILNAQSGLSGPEVDVVAEEQSFAEFAETFSTGPARSAPLPLPGESSQNPVPQPQPPAKSKKDPLLDFLQTARQDLETIGSLFSQIGRATDEAARQKLLEDIS